MIPPFDSSLNSNYHKYVIFQRNYFSGVTENCNEEKVTDGYENYPSK